MRPLSFRLLTSGTLSPFLLLLLVSHPAVAKPPLPEESLTLQELIELPDRDLANIDIATMNLAAAEGLPGSVNINRKAIRDTLDRWANGVAALTMEQAYRFNDYPEEYDNSWSKFCARNLLRTLSLYLGVHYNYEQRTNPSLAKSEDQFIHGIVGGTGGTCASLPVLFIAVGRRLGYPLKLAQGFSHYYVRWDDPVTGEQFNIEGSGDGWAFDGDDHYREMARKMGEESLEDGNYLTSMSPREELSTFLTTRADCLRENGRLIEAYNTYRKAVELAPRNLFAAGLLRMTGKSIQRLRSAQQAEAAFQRHERRRRTDPRIMIPGMPSIPTAQAVSVRGTGFGPPMPMGQSFQSPTGPALPRNLLQTKLDGTGWRLPSMQEHLDETNRRNQQLIRYHHRESNRRSRGAAPQAPLPRTVHQGTKP